MRYVPNNGNSLCTCRGGKISFRNNGLGLHLPRTRGCLGKGKSVFTLCSQENSGTGLWEKQQTEVKVSGLPPISRTLQQCDPRQLFLHLSGGDNLKSSRLVLILGCKLDSPGCFKNLMLRRHLRLIKPESLKIGTGIGICKTLQVIPQRNYI